METLLTTPFHDRTSALCHSQNWRPWAGYYSAGSYELTIDREYWAIRDSAALIDISPLMKYSIEGPDAGRLLNRVVTRDIDKLGIGKIYYTGWCDEEGKLIDDGTVWRVSESSFRLTAAEPSLRWLTMNAVGLQLEISDETYRMGALALQGPKSRSILNRCCERQLDELKYFRLMQNRLNGAPVTITRTGYTGDMGYEIWMDASDSLPVWDTLMEAGHDYGIRPVGILAMDIARVEAGMFMLEVDYTAADHAWIEEEKSTPYELGLGWTVDLEKEGYFVGRRALEREKNAGSAWKLVGLEVEWEGLKNYYADVGLPPQVAGMAVRESLPVKVGKKQVGYVSTATWSPVLKKFIALAHLQKPHYEIGTNVQMEITVLHQRRYAPAKVVITPFYDPEWKRE